MTIFGWDASHYDWDRGPMDLAAAVRDGIQFFTHKASEGSTYVDPQFAYAMARAKNAGMPLIGAYCVNRKGDQAPQVDKFIRVLDSGAPFWRLEPFLVQLDCERWSDKDGVYAYEPSLAEIHSWCDIFVQRTGGRLTPVVYAPKWVYGDTGLRGLRYPLWASSYGSNPAVPYRQAYPGDGSTRWGAYSGITPSILQFGSTTIIGAQGTCDANGFRGSLADLRALIGDDMTSSQGDHNIGYAIQNGLFGVEHPVAHIPAADGFAAGVWPSPFAEVLKAILEGRDAALPAFAAIPARTWVNGTAGRLTSIEAKLAALSVPAPAPVDPAVIEAAVKAALKDPAVLAAIATAVADEDHKRSAS